MYIPSSFIPVINEPKIFESSEEVYYEIKAMLGAKITEKEFFILITLNGASKSIRQEIIFIGTLNQSIVHPREVFRPAISDNAAGVIVVHNHPSGTLKASRADIQITTRLKEVGKLVGIELLDHVIVTADGWYSFSDQGLL